MTKKNISALKNFNLKPLNPDVDVEYIPHVTVIVSDSCNSGNSENYQNALPFSLESLSCKMLYKTLIHSCEIVLQNFQYFWKKRPKKALALKGLDDGSS